MTVLVGWNAGAVKEVRAESYNGYAYSVGEDGGVCITKYSGSETELVIPGEIEGKKVTSIGDFAFSDCSSNLVIWTTRNSRADRYARNNGITVKYIGEPEEPTVTPSPSPTPTDPAPSEEPVSNPTTSPSIIPTSEPNATPNPNSTTAPTGRPGPIPTLKPSGTLTEKPKSNPTASPSTMPTLKPSGTPTEKPDTHPTQSPAIVPTATPGSSTNTTIAPVSPQLTAQAQTQPQNPGVKAEPAEDQPTKADLAVKKGKVKASAGKKKLKLTWKKVAKASGYEIQVSPKKNFKGAKKFSVSKSRKSYTIKDLKSGTVYYVRIRAYTKADGKKCMENG